MLGAIDNKLLLVGVVRIPKLKVRRRKKTADQFAELTIDVNEPKRQRYDGKRGNHFTAGKRRFHIIPGGVAKFCKSPIIAEHTHEWLSDPQTRMQVIDHVGQPPMENLEVVCRKQKQSRQGDFNAEIVANGILQCGIVLDHFMDKATHPFNERYGVLFTILGLFGDVASLCPFDTRQPK